MCPSSVVANDLPWIKSITLDQDRVVKKFDLQVTSASGKRLEETSSRAAKIRLNACVDSDKAHKAIDFLTTEKQNVWKKRSPVHNSSKQKSKAVHIYGRNSIAVCGIPALESSMYSNLEQTS